MRRACARGAGEATELCLWHGWDLLGLLGVRGGGGRGPGCLSCPARADVAG